MVTGADLYADARRFASYHAAEQTLFVATGRWISEIDEPALRTRVAAWNQRHAEHLAWWAARYPTIDELPPIEELDRDPVFAEHLDGPFVPSDLNGALTALVDAYASHRVELDHRLDGPTARVLDLVLADGRAELAESSALIA